MVGRRWTCLGNAPLFLLAVGIILFSCDAFGAPGDAVAPGDEAQSLLSRGIAALEEGDLAGSERTFKRLIELHPEEPAGYANLGLSYIRLNDLAQAEANLAEALKRAPKSTPILWLHAKSAYRENKTAIAIDRLRTALDSSPDDYRIRYDLAFHLSHSPETAKEAADHLRKVIQARPRNFAARLELLKVILPEQNAPETLEHINAVRGMATVSGQAQNFLDQLPAHIESGDWTKATPMLRGVQNVLRATDRFRTDLKELKGPDDEQVGIPVDRFLVLSLPEPPAARPIPVSFKFEPLNTQALTGPVTAATDTNRDGAVDIVMAASDAVYLINTATPQKLVEGALNGGILAADLNNDHILDLVTWKDDQVRWFPGTASGYLPAGAATTLAFAGPIDVLRAADFDHDGDLDLFATSREKGDLLMRNNMDGTWTEVSEAAGLASGRSDRARDALFTDFNDDGDTDLAVGGFQGPVRLYDNVRQMTFNNISASAGLERTDEVRFLDAGDVDNDGDFDLIYTGPGAMSGIRLATQISRGVFGAPVEIRAASNCFGFTALRLADLNNDGWLDLIASDDGPGRIWPGDGRGGWSGEIPVNGPWTATSIQAVDIDNDRDLDLLIQSGGRAGILRNEGGNANHALCVDAVGMRQESIINNAFGVGSDLLVVSGGLRLKRTITEPRTLVGLGERAKADVVRVLFSNGVPINVFDPPVDVCITVKQVPKGSCPWLFVWNGERFVFVNDILTESGIGLRADETYTEAVDPDQIIAIRGEDWVPRGGHLEMRFAGELGESIYLDAVRLLAIDHPAGVEVVPNEGHGMPPFPEFKIHTVAKRLPLREARDDQGNDILPALVREDGRFWGDFEKDRLLSVAKRHSLILDFGDHSGSKQLTLFAVGWIWWPDTSQMSADAQDSSIELMLPKLEAMDREGNWTVVEEYMRYPAGQPKAAVIDLTGKVDASHVRLRVTTSLYLYWDTFYLSADPPELDLNTTQIPLADAHLHYRGYSAVVASGSSTPHLIDYHTVDHAQRWRPLSGNYTRYGDITRLVSQEDDAVATMNTGDEISLLFDAKALPELRKNMRRTWFFTAVGWDKDADLNTTASATLEPMPFHGMTAELYGRETVPGNVLKAREPFNAFQSRRIDDSAFRTWARYPAR